MQKLKSQFRFGIGEWYGASFSALSTEAKRHYAELQRSPDSTIPFCPFLSKTKKVPCWKKGGVCSLRLYEKTIDGEVKPSSTGSTLRVTCPSRFEENSSIYSWIGEVLLNSQESVAIGQVNFLQRMPLMRNAQELQQSDGSIEEVGRIDNVLVIPGSSPLKWCPVEIQAVYFSGDKMDFEFEAAKKSTATGVPFPEGRRRPDYRSSGPKRLMPQLLVKVPTLRRWGKKMAVVIDEDFFGEMGRMEPARDLSNCDVAWFVVGFTEQQGKFVLERRQVFLTTLESSQSGLVAARPVSQQEFEERITAKFSSTGA